MIIKNSEKWEYHNCSNCKADISQEEFNALHCNECDKDITHTLSLIELLTMPQFTPEEEKEFRIKNGLPES